MIKKKDRESGQVENIVRLTYEQEIGFIEIGIPLWLIPELVIYHGHQAMRYAYEHIEAHLNDVDSCYLCQIGWEA